jgi:hypothetical protein
MRRTVLALATAASVAGLAGTAAADTRPVAGDGCTATILPSPPTDPVDAVKARIQAGPVVVANVNAHPNTARATLTCTLVVDGTAAAGFPTEGLGVVYGAQDVTFTTPEQSLYLCSTLEIQGGATWYWDGSAWSTDPDAGCYSLIVPA